MTKVKVLTAAMATALISSTAMAAVTPEFHGYMRSGIGATGSGGDQKCFQADGSAYKHRLGNECETYAEIGLNAPVFEDGDQSMTVHTLLAHSVDQENDWEESPSAVREMYVDAQGMIASLPEAGVWAGKRYYQRSDVHQIDYYYLANAGAGAGIENIDLGFGKLSAAWLRNTSDALFDANVSATEEGFDKFTGNNLDLRLSGINTNEDGELSLVGIYGKYSEADGQNFNSKNQEDDGIFMMAEHTQGNFFGGFNKISLSYATDAMAGIGASGQLRGFSYSEVDVDPFANTAYRGDSNKGDWVRVLNWGQVTLTDSMDMTYVVNYENHDADDKTGNDLFTIGLRPQHNWSNTQATILDLGYDRVTFQDRADGNDNRMFKATVAQQWQPAADVWARPVFRAFATYANSDEVLRGTNSKDEVTFGFQAEAWW
ncbi:Maltoporin 1 [Vibrio chagasii]|nr:Maltoporin 1 [Vibrio chagasii]